MASTSMKRSLTILILFVIRCQSGFAVVNGSEVAATDPVTQSTVSISGPFFKSFGTGVLIGRRHVLTALHNVSLQFTTLIFAPGLFPLTVQFGEVAGNAGKIPVARTFYRRGLAILELAQDAPSGFVPARLVTGKIMKPGSKVTIAGYGVAEPSVLNDIPASLSSIGRLRKGSGTFVKISKDPTEIQTTADASGARFSFGDSGGPIFLADAGGEPVLTESGQLVLVGVLDRGLNWDGDAAGENVQYFDDWIRKISGAESCQSELGDLRKP